MLGVGRVDERRGLGFEAETDGEAEKGRRPNSPLLCVAQQLGDPATTHKLMMTGVLGAGWGLGLGWGC